MFEISTSVQFSLECCWVSFIEREQRHQTYAKKWCNEDGQTGSLLFLHRFIVDRRIFVVGFGMYGSIHGPSEYEVTVQLIHTLTGKVSWRRGGMQPAAYTFVEEGFQRWWSWHWLLSILLFLISEYVLTLYLMCIQLYWEVRFAVSHLLSGIFSLVSVYQLHYTHISKNI